MRTPRIYSRKNNMRSLLTRIENNVQKRTDYLVRMAETLYQQNMQASYRQDSNNFWGQSGASIASIYTIMTSGESSYEAQRAAFSTLYYRVHSSSRTLDEVTFDELEVKSSPGKYRALMASMSLIVAFWEYGHHNRFTNMYEHRPILAHTYYSLLPTIRKQYMGILSAKP
jgi:hypothetical protein